MIENNWLQPLKQAISEQDTLTASMILASRFSPNVDVADYLSKIDAFVEDALSRLDDDMAPESRFYQLQKHFHTFLAFSGNEKDYFASKYSLLNQVIDYRTGIPVCLAVLFCHLARRAGFDVAGVNFPGHFLIRYQVSEHRALFFNPLDGKSFDWQELETMYLSVVEDAEDDCMPQEVMQPASLEQVLVRQLHNLKAAFIREEAYQKALLAVELLVELCPDDPYERRDRGFLLHQLECPQVAMADYQFFIRQCPQDPAAQLLKLQLRHMSSHPPVVLH